MFYWSTFTATAIEMTVFWLITPCRIVVCADVSEEFATLLSGWLKLAISLQALSFCQLPTRFNPLFPFYSSDWSQSLQPSCTIDLFPLASHFSFQANKIQLQQRWKQHIPQKCWNKFMTLNRIIDRRIITEILADMLLRKGNWTAFCFSQSVNMCMI